MDPRQWFHGSWLPSKHRTPLQDQPMTRRWLPKLSATGPATGRLPYQKEMALLRWEDFLRSFIFLGGVEMFGCYTFEIFWLTWYLQLSAWGLFWCASIPIGNIVGTKTHFTWTVFHLVLGHRSQGFIVGEVRPTQIKRRSTPIQSTQWPAGGGWDFSTFRYIFHLLHKDGAPQPSCNLLLFLTLVMGWVYFSHPKAQ